MIGTHAEIAVIQFARFITISARTVDMELNGIARGV